MSDPIYDTCTCHLGPGVNLNCPEHGEFVQQMQSHAARQQGLCGHVSIRPYHYVICKKAAGHEVKFGDH